MKYRKEIDGLRAIAVLPVIMFHAGFELFGGGFVGVDVFFVISGYLISSIIFNELDNNRFSIIDFYERRARRILPVLFIIMVIAYPFAWFLLMPSEMKEYSKSIIAVSIFMSNMLFWRESGYFSQSAELLPLLHTWSLSVEEQFYLIYPLFLMLLWRYGKVRLKIIFSISLIISIGVASWLSYIKPAAAFYLLPTRAWELILGVLAAFRLSYPPAKISNLKINEFAGLLGLILIFYSVIFYSKNTPWPGLFALLPTLGALLIILFATEETYIGKFIGNKVFVQIGLISYSAYLLHQPILAFARHMALTQYKYFEFQKIAIILFIFVLSYFSWRFVEVPFRNKNYLNRKIIFTGVFCCIVMFSVVGAIGFFREGFNNRFPLYSSVMSSLQWPTEYNIQADCKNMFGGDQYCLISNQNEVPTDILIGDSHANHFFHGLSSRFSNEHRNLLMFGAGGCPPFIDVDMGFHYLHGAKLNCLERTNEKYKNLIKMNSVKNVFLSFSSDSYFDEGIQFWDVKDVIDFKNDRRRALTDAFLRIIEFARNNNKNVYVIEDLPNVSFDNFKGCLLAHDQLSMALPCLSVEYQNEEYFAMLDELRSNGVGIIYTRHLLKNFPFTDKGELMYRDSTHLSLAGSLYFGRSFQFNLK